MIYLLYVCTYVYVCMNECIFTELHNITGPVIPWSFCATRIDPPKKGSMMFVCMYVQACMYIVVVVDSHIQRIVLATEETTVTQQVSHRPIKCQSRLWSQRGTKVNGSHHGDNPLLRPTGIQIATKSYAALQAMAPTNIKTVHQTSLLHIESNLDRLGMLSPTHEGCLYV